MEWAINAFKLRRIMDKMPNATEAELKAEYIKQGGLVKEVETIETPKKETPKPAKKTSKVTKVVKAVVKKVTKKK